MGIRRIALTTAWVIVLIQAVLFARLVFNRPYSTVYRCVAIYFVVLAGAGLARRWGETVLFGIGAFCILFYWQPYSGISFSHMEAVMQDVVYPAIGVILAGILGGIVEAMQRLTKRE